MGFLDKLTQQASEVASNVAVKTQEVAKTGQLQLQLRMRLQSRAHERARTQLADQEREISRVVEGGRH